MIKISGTQIDLPNGDILKAITGDVTDGGIVESGSNENGSWTKWANGDLECRVSGFSVSGIESTSPPILGRTWTFPAAFIDTNYSVTVSPSQGSVSDAAPALNTRYNTPFNGKTTTDVSLRVISSSSTAFVSGNFVLVDAVAKGRWKA